MHDLGPNERAWRAARARYQVELVGFRAGLEDGLLGEELAEYAAARPHVDARTIAFFAEEKLGRAVPQSDYFVRVGSIFVVSIVETGETEVGQLDLTLTMKNRCFIFK